MLDFEITQDLQLNAELLELLNKRYTYTIKIGKIKHLVNTNLQFIEPTE